MSANGLTVVVPTFGRPERLARCVAALARLDVPPGGFEVVVVDDGSPQPAAPVVERHAGDLAVRVVRQPNAGPAAARNRGAEEAGGGLLAFTDDDCEPHPGWVVALAEAAEREPGAMLGGRTRNAVDGDRCARASQLLVEHVMRFDGVQPQFVPSNNVAVPAEAFRAIVGFDTDFPRAAGEDRDLCRRWLDSGRRIVAAPDALVDHHHAFTLRAYCRQHQNYGRGAYRFHRSRAAGRGGRLQLEPLRFYTDLLRSPFRSDRGAEAMALAALLVLSQVANGAGFALEWAASRRAA